MDDPLPQEDNDVPIYTLASARRHVENLHQCLPQSVSIGALGVRSKMPFYILCVREALAWRTEELSRTACNAVEKGDVVAAILLTRAVMESTAYIWRLRKLLVTRTQFKPEEFRETVWKMFAGGKNAPGFPASINIQTLINDIDKTINGFKGIYDLLSEVAHPNYSGVAGHFAEIDKPNFIMNFAHGWSRNEDRTRSAIDMLTTCLDFFITAYNDIADQMPGYLAELEPI